MLKNITILIIVCWFPFSTWGQNVWKIDPGHSNVQFEVTHLSISTVTGKFTEFSGEIKSNGDSFDGAQINVSVGVGSIDTENLTRDKHLKEDDFFNVKKYPQMTFTSTSFKRNSETEYLVTGQLTIRDVTREISFIATYGGQIKTGEMIIRAFSASFTINRFEYKLKWDDTLDTGGLVVGDEVTIKMNVRLLKT